MKIAKTPKSTLYELTYENRVLLNYVLTTWMCPVCESSPSCMIMIHVLGCALIIQVGLWVSENKETHLRFAVNHCVILVVDGHINS